MAEAHFCQFKGKENICNYWVHIPFPQRSRAARLMKSVTVPNKKPQQTGMGIFRDTEFGIRFSQSEVLVKILCF